MNAIDNTIDSEAVAIALDRLLRRHPGGGPRSHVVRLNRDVLLVLCHDIADPRITNSDVFAKLERDLGGRCPGRSSLYRFADCFLAVYAEVRSELDGATLHPELAALPIHEVARRLCLKPAQVQHLIDGGKLHAVELAGQVRVPMESLQTLLAERKP